MKYSILHNEIFHSAQWNIHVGLVEKHLMLRPWTRSHWYHQCAGVTRQRAVGRSGGPASVPLPRMMPTYDMNIPVIYLSYIPWSVNDAFFAFESCSMSSMSLFACIVWCVQFISLFIRLLNRTKLYTRYILDIFQSKPIICQHHSWQRHASGPAGSPNRSLPRHPCTLMVSMWACSGPWHEVFSYQDHTNISLCRMEYFIMQNKIFHYAE